MDVVVVGSCMTDLISRVPRLPKPGETIHGHSFTVGFGGKGANQCVMAAKLGAKTAMVGKVGKDLFGRNYIKNLEDHGINIDHLGTTSAAATGTAPIAVDDEGQNSIVIVAGANLLLTPEDVMEADGLIKQAQVLICQLETSEESTLAALKLARAHQVTTILNPAPAKDALDPEIYKYCDIICPNETEAELLTGHPVVTIEDAERAILHLLELGCNTAIITQGDKGVTFASVYDRAPKHVKTSRVKATDTTGAGDAFVGALAFYLSTFSDLSMRESIRRACEIATISVQMPGTQTSYPTREDIPAELLSHSEETSQQST